MLSVEYDYSAMSDYLKCPKRGYYRHILNLVPISPAPALSFGGAIHEALSSWYQFKDEGKALKVFQENWQTYIKESKEAQDSTGWGSISPAPVDDSKRNMKNGLLILQAYFERYAKESFEVLSNEFPFRIKLGTYKGIQFNLTGKIDLYVKWGNYIYVLDHKSTSQLGEYYFEQFNPSLQIDGYAYAGKKIFTNCDGAVVNAILVAKTKTDFKREIFTKTEEELQEYKNQALEIMHHIEMMKERKKFFCNTDACSLYGHCPYLELCRAKGDERVMRLRYKVSPWSPFNA